MNAFPCLYFSVQKSKILQNFLKIYTTISRTKYGIEKLNFDFVVVVVVVDDIRSLSYLLLLTPTWRGLREKSSCEYKKVISDILGEIKFVVEIESKCKMTHFES